MKNIGIISDLHLDHYNFEFTDLMKDQINRLNALRTKEGKGIIDLLVVAGDISDNHIRSIKYLESISKFIKVKAVLGNHDMYYTDKSIINLIEEFDKTEFSLYTNPIQSENTVIIGDTGWHDNTVYKGRTRYQEDRHDVEYKRLNKGGLSDKELSLFFKNRMESILNRYKHNNCIPVTHYAPHPSLVRSKEEPISNIFGNSYGHKLYKKFSIKQAIYGHTHGRGVKAVDKIEYITSSLGYKHEYEMGDLYLNGFIRESVYSVFMDNLTIIDI